jgi:two-component system sensor histidine kinase KdpD
MGAGPLAAIGLGMALVPLRGLTHASNFTFAFLVLTIVAAELGGRGPGLLTALVSVLSLDFFLTKPYLRLSIDAKDDVIAFLGLGVCGLVAAALGSHRAAEPERGSARQHLDLLHEVIRGLHDPAPLEPAPVGMLRAARAGLPLSAAVVRDARGDVLASAAPADRDRPLPPPASPDATGAGVPQSGARVALTAGDRTVGFLDVWGDGRRWGAEPVRTLEALTALLGLCLQDARGTAR